MSTTESTITTEEVPTGNNDYDYSDNFPADENKAKTRESSGQGKARQLMSIGGLLKTMRINRGEEPFSLMPVYKPPSATRKKRSLSPVAVGRIANLANLTFPSGLMGSRINFDFVGSKNPDTYDVVEQVPTTAVWAQNVRDNNKLQQLAKTDGENGVESSYDGTLVPGVDQDMASLRISADFEPLEGQKADESSSKSSSVGNTIANTEKVKEMLSGPAANTSSKNKTVDSDGVVINGSLVALPLRNTTTAQVSKNGAGDGKVNLTAAAGVMANKSSVASPEGTTAKSTSPAGSTVASVVAEMKKPAGITDEEKRVTPGNMSDAKETTTVKTMNVPTSTTVPVSTTSDTQKTDATTKNSSISISEGTTERSNDRTSVSTTLPSSEADTSSKTTEKEEPVTDEPKKDLNSTIDAGLMNSTRNVSMADKMEGNTTVNITGGVKMPIMESSSGLAVNTTTKPAMVTKETEDDEVTDLNNLDTNATTSAVTNVTETTTKPTLQQLDISEMKENNTKGATKPGEGITTPSATSSTTEKQELTADIASSEMETGSMVENTTLVSKADDNNGTKGSTEAMDEFTTSSSINTTTEILEALTSNEDAKAGENNASTSFETTSDEAYTIDTVLSSLTSIMANASKTTETASLWSSTTVPDSQGIQDDEADTEDSDYTDVIGTSPDDQNITFPYICPPFDMACKPGSSASPHTQTKSLEDSTDNSLQSDESAEHFKTEVYASVETRLGRVLGKEIQPGDVTPLNYYAFMGMPFAEPPVGELRFEPPVPHQGWTGTWNGTVPRPKCIQYEIFKTMDIVGQEDCLYINVYTSKLPEKKGDASMPVLFYIPGGFFTSASADPEDLNPAALVLHNVVVVTVNYRLGPLGFLSLEDEAAPGNYGLQDVIMALKWVYSNIRYFGGDKRLITIGGYGSGASLAHLMTFVPEVREMFTGIILQGGSALSAGALTQGHRTASLGVAKELGCAPNGTSNDLLDCLREQKASNIVRAARKIAKWQIFPLVFTPRIDIESRKPTISCDPRELLDRGEFCRVPMLAGFPKDIGLINTFTVLSVPDPYLSDLNANWSRLCPYALQLDKAGCDCDRKALCKVIRKEYFGPRDIDLTTAYDLTNLMGDRWFKQATVLAAEKHSKHADAYVYVHNYEPKVGFKDILFSGVRKDLFKISNPYTDGAFYGDDLLAVFPPKGPNQTSTTDSEVSELVVELWTNFLKERKPVAGSAEPFLSWPKYTEDDRRFYMVDNPPRQSRNPVSRDSFKFWDFVSFIAGDS